MSGDFFEVFNFEQINDEDFAFKINATENADRLVCVFFWGHDCPNCEVAKKALVEHQTEVLQLDMKWYQANIYEDFNLATRFGIFGIPIFIFFRNGKKLGKISPFPGFDPFYDALMKLL